MSTRYILQYRFEIIGSGEWSDEAYADEPEAAHALMAKHIAEYPDMQCRLVKIVHDRQEVAFFQPLQLFRENNDE